MSNIGSYPHGTRIVSRVADEDTDQYGRRRLVPAGSTGTVKGFVDGLYDIAWDSGAWTRWTRKELNNDAVKEQTT